MSTATEAKRGIVYTFYSYKGGSGRTMALANVATLLARWRYRVLVLDWDLEAPGIERFFVPDEAEAHRLRASRPGILDLVLAKAHDSALNWRECTLDVGNGVSLITAGREDGKYIERLHGLEFGALFAKGGLGAYIEQLRTEWITEFDLILIDSRTGVTDIGGICTVHLPDVLVLFITATDSSAEGALEVVKRARQAQERLPLERGRLIAVPVPSRDESRTEYEKATMWKQSFADRFREFYKDWLPGGIDAREAVEALRIPYIPYWSFGETLPVTKEAEGDPGSLAYSYEILARLLSTRLDWYKTFKDQLLPPAPIKTPREISGEWLGKHHAAAFSGFKKSELAKSTKAGFMEAFHYCLDAVKPKDQRELLVIARQAAVHTFGWPIGVVLDNREEFRPRPTNEGILAELDTGHNYDYWTLTRTGDFYILTGLFEDFRGEQVLFFNTRIIRVTEVVMHCLNIYKAFGAEPGARIALTVGHGGLKGRTLTATQGRLFHFPHKNDHEDEVTTSTVFKVDASELEIVDIVKGLCEPLFMVFDFEHFDYSIYKETVTAYLKGRAT